MGSSYKIVLTGLQFRQDRKQVKENLAKLFKCETDRIETLLGKAPVAIKTGIGLEVAMKYQKAIQDAGAECMVKSSEE